MPERRAILLTQSNITFSLQDVWAERIKRLPEPGKIRLLESPVAELEKYWYADMTLTQWIDVIDSLKADMESNPIFRAMMDPHIVETVTTIFESNQRARWLASVVLRKWKTRVWAKRTQCNVDMIDMAPIRNSDAILLVDTTQRQTFRFHRRDIYHNLIANICMSEEMMPYPRVPTNPWTNVPLTLAQTISICSQLCMDYAKRGGCPPVMLAAFCEARFNMTRFKQDNASMLAQAAIYSFFKDLSPENQDTVYDTIAQLLTEARLRFTPPALARWLRKTPSTDLHKEWLLLVRDYTVYINIHVQVREHWMDLPSIYRDVRELYERTTIDMPVSTSASRFRIVSGSPGALAATTLFSLNFIDPSTGLQIPPIDNDLAMLLLSTSMLR